MENFEKEDENLTIISLSRPNMEEEKIGKGKSMILVNKVFVRK